jgi:thioesterase domain-containing protein
MKKIFNETLVENTQAELLNCVDDLGAFKKRGLALFLLHDSSGELFYARTIASFVPVDSPIYGLPISGLDEPQCRTLQGMASRMVRLMRAVQADGPYKVAGLDLGGILAYEIAIQLLGEDEQVAFIGVFGSIDISQVRSQTNAILDDKRRLIAELRDAIGPPTQQHAHIHAIDGAEAQMNFSTLLAQCRTIKPDFQNEDTAIEIQHRWQVERNLLHACRQYSPLPIPHTIDIFASDGVGHENIIALWRKLLPADQSVAHRVKCLDVALHPFDLCSLSTELLISVRRIDAVTSRAIKNTHNPLVILQSGLKNEAPLFCVPGAGANVVSFIELTQCLEKSIPIYGLQPRGLDCSDVPHTTVKAAADYYSREIDRLYPNGDIHLLGHSYGGWVVFEMANQLREFSRNVLSLTIIDSTAPSSKNSQPKEYSISEVVMCLVEVFEQIAERPLNIHMSDLISRDESEQLALLHLSLVRQTLLPCTSTPDALYGMMRTFASCVRTHYLPSTQYLGNVLLLLASDPSLDATDNQHRMKQCAEEWRNCAPNLSFKECAGNHMTALKLPHVKAIADCLQLFI